MSIYQVFFEKTQIFNNCVYFKMIASLKKNQDILSSNIKHRKSQSRTCYLIYRKTFRIA